MKKNEEFNFTIERMDTMGQGVHKDEKGVVFVSKTLPGEKGKAILFASKKGVGFASISSPDDINTKSNDRRPAECPHYNECPGCHFQHTSYEKEIDYKVTSLQQHLRKINPGLKVEQHLCEARYHHRNRIQLHYNIRENKLGLYKNEKIIPIPSCLLGTPKVSEKIKEIYQQDWPNLFKSWGLPNQGHIEFYEQKGEVKLSANEAYAFGGFTQVNVLMNDKLKNLIMELVKKIPSSEFENKQILDLFGGDGNLSQKLIPNHSFVVDSQIGDKRTYPLHQTFIPINLYEKNAANKLLKALPPKTTPGLLLIDPPRSGLNNIADFIKIWPAPYMIYVSCWPSTMARDLETIKNQYQIIEIHLMDLFPATYHYESILFLKKIT